MSRWKRKIPDPNRTTTESDGTPLPAGQQAVTPGTETVYSPTIPGAGTPTTELPELPLDTTTEVPTLQRGDQVGSLTKELVPISVAGDGLTEELESLDDELVPLEDLKSLDDRTTYGDEAAATVSLSDTAPRETDLQDDDAILLTREAIPGDTEEPSYSEGGEPGQLPTGADQTQRYNAHPVPPPEDGDWINPTLVQTNIPESDLETFDEEDGGAEDSVTIRPPLQEVPDSAVQEVPDSAVQLANTMLGTETGNALDVPEEVTISPDYSSLDEAFGEEAGGNVAETPSRTEASLDALVVTCEGRKFLVPSELNNLTYDNLQRIAYKATPKTIGKFLEYIVTRTRNTKLETLNTILPTYTGFIEVFGVDQAIRVCKELPPALLYDSMTNGNPILQLVYSTKRIRKGVSQEDLANEFLKALVVPPKYLKKPADAATVNTTTGPSPAEEKTTEPGAPSLSAGEHPVYRETRPKKRGWMYAVGGVAITALLFCCGLPTASYLAATSGLFKKDPAPIEKPYSRTEQVTAEPTTPAVEYIEETVASENEPVTPEPLLESARPVDSKLSINDYVQIIEQELKEKGALEICIKNETSPCVYLRHEEGKITIQRGKNKNVQTYSSLQTAIETEHAKLIKEHPESTIINYTLHTTGTMVVGNQYSTDVDLNVVIFNIGHRISSDQDAVAETEDDDATSEPVTTRPYEDGVHSGETAEILRDLEEKVTSSPTGTFTGYNPTFDHSAMSKEEYKQAIANYLTTEFYSNGTVESALKANYTDTIYSDAVGNITVTAFLKCTEKVDEVQSRESLVFTFTDENLTFRYTLKQNGSMSERISGPEGRIKKTDEGFSSERYEEITEGHYAAMHDYLTENRILSRVPTTLGPTD
jgi:hypothetical protein